ncbi:MAG: hypothetical protein QM775_05290 [Pirellulales bacterium]
MIVQLEQSLPILVASMVLDVTAAAFLLGAATMRSSHALPCAGIGILSGSLGAMTFAEFFVGISRSLRDDDLVVLFRSAAALFLIFVIGFGYLIVLASGGHLTALSSYVSWGMGILGAASFFTFSHGISNLLRLLRQ